MGIVCYRQAWTENSVFLARQQVLRGVGVRRFSLFVLHYEGFLTQKSKMKIGQFTDVRFSHRMISEGAARLAWCQSLPFAVAAVVFLSAPHSFSSTPGFCPCFSRFLGGTSSPGGNVRKHLPSKFILAVWPWVRYSTSSSVTFLNVSVTMQLMDWGGGPHLIKRWINGSSYFNENSVISRWGLSLLTHCSLLVAGIYPVWVSGKAFGGRPCGFEGPLAEGGRHGSGLGILSPFLSASAGELLSADSCIGAQASRDLTWSFNRLLLTAVFLHLSIPPHKQCFSFCNKGTSSLVAPLLFHNFLKKIQLLFFCLF